MTANEFTNVKDVRDMFLYTKDGYIISYLQIKPFALNLLSDDEKRGKCNNLSASFESDRKDFVYFTLPREIDLDGYKQEMKERYSSELSHLGKKRLLAEMLGEANRLATSGENYEHQHYIKLWVPITGDKVSAENNLRNRVNEFRNRYFAAGIDVDVLRDAAILKLCNLFGNASQASYEQMPGNLFFEEIPMI